jgi:hypothetical protein
MASGTTSAGDDDSDSHVRNNKAAPVNADTSDAPPATATKSPNILSAHRTGRTGAGVYQTMLSTERTFEAASPALDNVRKLIKKYNIKTGNKHEASSASGEAVDAAANAILDELAVAFEEEEL